jgi:hypothetical protein
MADAADQAYELPGRTCYLRTHCLRTHAVGRQIGRQGQW